MMTNIEVGYLNNILSIIPTDQSFRISDFLPLISLDSENSIFLDDTETSLAAPIITDFLVEKDFAIYISDGFLDLPNQSRFISLTEEGRRLILEGSYQNYARNIIQEPNQLIRLDWILSFMATHSAQGIWLEQAWKKIKREHPTIHIEFLESYRQQMIDKLVVDKYLSFESGICKITLKGLLFDNEGGYVGEHNRKNVETKRILNLEEHQKTNQRDTTRLTLLLAVFALISIFIQSFDKFHVIFGIHFWTATFIFLAGILTGTIIFLLIMEILSKKKNRNKST